MIRVLLALAFLLAGCASPAVVPLRTVPSAERTSGRDAVKKSLVAFGIPFVALLLFAGLIVFGIEVYFGPLVPGSPE